MNQIMYNEIKITISIGVSIYNYTDLISLESLIKIADEALYKAKKNGRNIVCT
jgi:diguanylate cyclase (GGDEF)-like protein